ncbi:MAG: iron ABC transporter permease [Armatimonadota bacterium]|nr:iron ABC transporter permease [Armatimonadota bacterium]MDW8143425.1 iron ABC transporter permease [Armatimonadota bacterium]
MKSGSSSLPTTSPLSLTRSLRRLRYEYSPMTLNLWFALWFVFLGFLFYPIAFMLKGAVVYEGRFTLDFFALLLRDPQLADALKGSFGLAFTSTALTLALAVPIAYAMVRVRLPFKGVLNVLLLVPMISPPFVSAIAVRKLLARFGPINQLLISLGLVDPTNPPSWLDYPFWGIVILQVLHFLPIAYLNCVAALARIDRSLEEAAQSLGASGFRLFRTVTLPLMMPGLFAAGSLVFILAFTDLGTPLVFNYTRVIAVQVFHRVEQALEDPTGYAMVLLVMVLSILIFWTSKRWAERWQVQTIPRAAGETGERVLPMPLTIAITASILLVAFLAILPNIAVVLNAFADRWFMTILPDRWTLKYFQQLLVYPLAATSIRNSLLYSLASALLDIILGLAIAYIVVRRKAPLPQWLDSTAMLPLAIPGIVIAFGYVGAFANTPLDPRQNPALLLIIAYAIRRLPYMVRACYAGLQQVSEALEEASLNLGASPLRTFVKVTLPQIVPHLIAGGIMAFAFAMLEVSDSLILAFDQQYFPITKAIYVLANRLEGGVQMASAMGVLGMVVLALALAISTRLMGRRMGEVFRV